MKHLEKIANDFFIASHACQTVGGLLYIAFIVFMGAAIWGFIKNFM